MRTIFTPSWPIVLLGARRTINQTTILHSCIQGNSRPLTEVVVVMVVVVVQIPLHVISTLRDNIFQPSLAHVLYHQQGTPPTAKCSKEGHSNKDRRQHTSGERNKVSSHVRGGNRTSTLSSNSSISPLSEEVLVGVLSPVVEPARGGSCRW